MKKRKAMALALCAAMMMGTFGGFEVKAADDSSATEMIRTEHILRCGHS